MSTAKAMETTAISHHERTDRTDTPSPSNRRGGSIPKTAASRGPPGVSAHSPGSPHRPARPCAVRPSATLHSRHALRRLAGGLKVATSSQASGLQVATYTMRTPSEHHPYNISTISVHHPYTIRTPSVHHLNTQCGGLHLATATHAGRSSRRLWPAAGTRRVARGGCGL